MGWSFTIGRIAGTAVKLHGTFLLLIAFVAMRGFREGGGPGALEAVVLLLTLFTCVLLHEFGHVAAARRYGVRTPDVLLLPIGGVARLERMPDEPRQELVIALGGPLVTLVLAAGAWALLALTDAPPGTLLESRRGVRLLEEVWRVNAGLLLFNMIPAFPMDGGRVLRALLASRLGLVRATAIAATIGRTLAILAGFWAVGNGQLLLALVALFVFLGAGSEQAAVEERRVLSGRRVAEFMVPRVAVLPMWGTLQSAIELLASTEQREIPVVDVAGRVTGLLTRDTLIRGLRSGSTAAEIRTAMHEAPPVVRDDMPIEAAIDAMRQARLPAVPVVDADGRPVALLTMDNVLDLLLTATAPPR